MNIKKKLRIRFLELQEYIYFERKIHLTHKEKRLNTKRKHIIEKLNAGHGIFYSVITPDEEYRMMMTLNDYSYQLEIIENAIDDCTLKLGFIQETLYKLRDLM